MWDKEAVLDLQAKAEEYLLEHRPQGYRHNDQAEADGKRLRSKIDRAYYGRDAARHKEAVDEMVLSTLQSYADWLWVHRGETLSSAGSRTTQ